MENFLKKSIYRFSFIVNGAIKFAFYAFSDFKTFDALNSFYDEKFADNEDKQIKKYKKIHKKWRGDKNLVLVTHYVVIISILGVGSSSGEIVVVDKNLILQEGLAIIKNHDSC